LHIADFAPVGAMVFSATLGLSDVMFLISRVNQDEMDEYSYGDLVHGAYAGKSSFPKPASETELHIPTLAAPSQASPYPRLCK
jgi:hypothetical protein